MGRSFRFADLADRLGRRCRRRRRSVFVRSLGHVGVDPGDAVVGVAVDDAEADLSARRVDGDRQARRGRCARPRNGASRLLSSPVGARTVGAAGPRRPSGEPLRLAAASTEVARARPLPAALRTRMIASVAAVGTAARAHGRARHSSTSCSRAADGSRSCAARRASARPRSCAASASSSRPTASSGAPATRSTRRGRSARSSTSPTRPAASSSRSPEPSRSPTSWPPRSCASWSGRRPDRRGRGRALGRRGDARRPADRRRDGSRRLPALVVATYRDDELDRRHPLRRLLGELAAGRPRGPDRRSRRCRPKRSPRSPRRTASTPTTSTARRTATRSSSPSCSRPAEPSSRRPLRDAVLARAGRLEPQARSRRRRGRRDVPPHAELWLLEALVPDGDRRARRVPRLRDAASRTAEHVVVPPRARAARDRGARCPRTRAQRAARDGRSRRSRSRRRRAATRAARPPRGRRGRRRRGAALRAGRRGTGGVGRRASRGGGALRAGARVRRPARAAGGAPSCSSGARTPATSPTRTRRRSRRCARRSRSTTSAGDIRAEGDALRALSTYLWCPGPRRRVAGGRAATRSSCSSRSAEPSSSASPTATSRSSARTAADGDDGARLGAARARDRGAYDDPRAGRRRARSPRRGRGAARARLGPEKLERAPLELAREHGLRRGASAWIGLVIAPHMLRDARVRRTSIPLLEAAVALLRRARASSSTGCTTSPTWRAPSSSRGCWAQAADHADEVLRLRRASTTPTIFALVGDRAAARAPRRPGPVVAARRGGASSPS